MVELYALNVIPVNQNNSIYLEMKAELVRLDGVVNLAENGNGIHIVNWDKYQSPPKQKRRVEDDAEDIPFVK